MSKDNEPEGPRPVDGPSGLSAEEKSNLIKAAIFVVAAVGLILGLKFLLGY